MCLIGDILVCTKVMILFGLRNFLVINLKNIKNRAATLWGLLYMYKCVCYLSLLSPWGSIP